MILTSQKTHSHLKKKNYHLILLSEITWCLLYGFFWVIPWRLNFICRRFGTLCLFHLHRQVGNLLAYERGTECSETSACKIQTPGNYPEESIQLNPLNPELNPICYLLALLGAHHFLHVSRIRVKLLTFR